MNDALAGKMAELAARFRGRAGAEGAAIAEAAAIADRVTLAERAHKLAGLAGMFGHDELGAAAIELEAAAESGADFSDLSARVVRLLAAL